MNNARMLASVHMHQSWTSNNDISRQNMRGASVGPRFFQN